MSFLTINGTAFPVELNSMSETVEDIGESGRSHGGYFHRTRQARKRLFSFNSIPLIEADARAWRGMVEGDGHCWNFAVALGLYSKKGLAPTSMAGLAQSGAQAKFGSGSMAITNATGTGIFATGGDGTLGATFSFWEYTGAGAVWDNWVYRWNGATFDKYKNGVATGTSPAKCVATASTTSITIATITDGSTRYVDDVVALPFVVPVAWITSFAFPGTAAGYVGAPYSTIAGDLLGTGVSLVVAGVVDSSAYTAGSYTTPLTNLQRLVVKLMEV